MKLLLPEMELQTPKVHIYESLKIPVKAKETHFQHPLLLLMMPLLGYFFYKTSR